MTDYCCVVKYREIKDISEFDQWLIDYKNAFFNLGIGNMCTVWYKFKRYLIARDDRGTEYIVDMTDLTEMIRNPFYVEYGFGYDTQVDGEFNVMINGIAFFDYDHPYKTIISVN